MLYQAAIACETARLAYYATHTQEALSRWDDAWIELMMPVLETQAKALLETQADEDAS